MSYNNVMETKDIIVKNLITLRKEKGWTQAELSKKVNFSDKAISRWEKGEVVPDIETLDKLAKIYGKDITYFFKEHINTENKKESLVFKYNQIIMSALCISIVWLIATVLFFYLNTIYHFLFWQAFVWAIPISMAIIIFFNKKLKNKVYVRIFGSIFIWTFLASLYLQFLEQNLWLIFVIGVPIQALVLFASFLKQKEVKEDEEN